MRFYLAIFFSALMLSSCQSLGSPGYRIDEQATAQAQWEPGEMVAEGDIYWVYFDGELNLYRKFIGITTQGYVVVQDFYVGSGNKFTDPYMVMQPERIGDIGLVKDEVDNISSTLVDGKLTLWYENGQKGYEFHYQDGKGQGLLTWWYENGQRAIEMNFQNDKPQGLLTQWYENGQKAVVGNNQDGKEQGLWTIWDESGKKTREVLFEAGEVVSETDF